ncbi:hypothetical protein M0R45_026052 [Rubus argutus]|uniref:Uncharacterized protein n=1 Tax=Rubus argutus TaxID=59490 RepID=A0AAW1WZS2_RUBAR
MAAEMATVSSRRAEARNPEQARLGGEAGFEEQRAGGSRSDADTGLRLSGVGLTREKERRKRRGAPEMREHGLVFHNHRSIINSIKASYPHRSQLLLCQLPRHPWFSSWHPTSTAAIAGRALTHLRATVEPVLDLFCPARDFCTFAAQSPAVVLRRAFSDLLYIQPAQICPLPRIPSSPRTRVHYSRDVLPDRLSPRLQSDASVFPSSLPSINQSCPIRISRDEPRSKPATPKLHLQPSAQPESSLSSSPLSLAATVLSSLSWSPILSVLSMFSREKEK